MHSLIESWTKNGPAKGQDDQGLEEAVGRAAARYSAVYRICEIPFIAKKKKKIEY